MAILDRVVLSRRPVKTKLGMFDCLVTSPRTFADVFFQVLLAFYGLQTSSAPRRWITLVSSLFWITMVTVFPFGDPKDAVVRLISAGSSRLSLSELMGNFGVISYSIMAVYSVFLLTRRHKEIEPLLQRSGRSMTYVLQFVVFIAPITVFSILPIYSNMGVSVQLKCLTFLLFYVSTVAFQLVYEDVVENLVKSHARLRVSLMFPKLSWSTLTSEKWRIRDQTRDINSVFSFPLTIFYLQLLWVTVYHIGEIIERKQTLLNAFLLGLCGFLIVAQILRLACCSSEVIKLCLEQESELLRRLCRDATLTNTENAAIKLMQFREEWDSLRVGCFVHSLANFLRFVSVLTTCVAVVLQFDFRVMRKISSSS